MTGLAELALEALFTNDDTEMLYRSQVPLPLKHLCYAALADLFKYLPQSKADPHDVVARQKLQIASWMSLWPFMNYDIHPAIGLSHVLGHKLGVSYGIPHGMTSVRLSIVATGSGPHAHVGCGLLKVSDTFQSRRATG